MFYPGGYLLYWIWAFIFSSLHCYKCLCYFKLVRVIYTQQKTNTADKISNKYIDDNPQFSSLWSAIYQQNVLSLYTNENYYLWPYLFNLLLRVPYGWVHFGLIYSLLNKVFYSFAWRYCFSFASQFWTRVISALLNGDLKFEGWEWSLEAVKTLIVCPI